MFKTTLLRLSLCVVLLVMVASTTSAWAGQVIEIHNSVGRPIWVHVYTYDDDSETTSLCADKWLVPRTRWLVGAPDGNYECAEHSRFKVVVDARGIYRQPPPQDFVYEMRHGHTLACRPGQSSEDVDCVVY